MEQGVGGQNSGFSGRRPQAPIAIGTLKGKEKETAHHQQEILTKIEEQLTQQLASANEQQKIYLQQDLDAINILKQNAEITSEQVLYGDLEITTLIKSLTERWKLAYSENANTIQVYISQIPQRIRMNTELIQYMLSTLAFIALKHCKNQQIVFRINVVQNPLNTKSMYFQTQLDFISEDLDKQLLDFYFNFSITKENLPEFETQIQAVNPGFLGFATALNLVYGQIQKAQINKMQTGQSEVEIFLSVEIPVVPNQTGSVEAQKLSISTKTGFVAERCSIEEASPTVVTSYCGEEAKKEL